MRASFFYTILAAAALLAPIGAVAQTTSQREVTSVDRTFVQQAVNANDMEIFEGRAMIHSGDPYVRRFANTIIRDHTLANSQIGALAAQHGLPFSHRTIQQLNTDMTAMYGPTMSPAARTRMMRPATFMARQVRDHEKSIALFRSEMRNGGSLDFKTLAGNQLPVLEKHLRMAQSYPGSR